MECVATGTVIPTSVSATPTPNLSPQGGEGQDATRHVDEFFAIKMQCHPSPLWGGTLGGTELGGGLRMSPMLHLD